MSDPHLAQFERNVREIAEEITKLQGRNAELVAAIEDAIKSLEAGSSYDHLPLYNRLCNVLQAEKANSPDR